MNENTIRENKMYFISDTEYIYLPIQVRSKTHKYFTTQESINQLVHSIYNKKKVS